jgi:hypothetical protein
MGVHFGSDEQRRLLELSFEPHGDGYLYYRNRWARGVPVTAAEREEYLAPGVMGSRAAFYAAIRGRAAVAPPRKFGPVYWQMLSRMPTAMGVAALLFGLKLSSGWFSTTLLVERAALLVLGGGLVLFGAQLVYVRGAARTPR